VKTEAEVGVTHLKKAWNIQECWQPQNQTEAQNTLPQELSLPPPYFNTGLQNWEKIYFHCFKSWSLCHFAKAALGI
jgi:hypothetical protein